MPNYLVVTVDDVTAQLAVVGPDDVGADQAGTASTTVAAHEGAVDPHPQYYDTARLSARRGLAGRYTATLGSGNNIQQIVDCGLGTVLAGVNGVPEVWISTDGGATFPTSVTLGSGTGVSSIVQLSSGTVLAGVFGVPEVWISTDGGATFPSSATIGIGAAVMCIAQLPSGWVVAGGLGGTPIMASSDEGGTWTPLLDVIGGARIASLVGARSLLIGGFSSTHIHIVQEVLL